MGILDKIKEIGMRSSPSQSIRLGVDCRPALAVVSRRHPRRSSPYHPVRSPLSHQLIHSQRMR